MSEEMAVSDNASGEDAFVQESATAAGSVEPATERPQEQSSEAPPEAQDNTAPVEENAEQQTQSQEPDNNELADELDLKPDLVKQEVDPDTEIDGPELEQVDGLVKEEVDTEHMVYDADEKKGIKRRASDAFSDEDNNVEFKGFDQIKLDIATDDYTQVLERLEAEVSAATKDFTPVRHVMATPSAPIRASKRPRKDTDGSRPSSAQSSRSEGDDNPTASPAHKGRRPTTEMSSPLLRVPLERGWKRELVYRAALDAYSRRNADIYYYTPQGKKLRSTREVAEQLGGTGLTLENFSFFKEPLGVDDPEREIIRDAKMIRRNESPISSPAQHSVEGKRTPKPKQPKGVSPDPPTLKSPPAKLKVKSMGSRLSGAAPAAAPAPAPAPAPAGKPQRKAATAPAPAPAPAPTPTDNNNTAAWKKPRAPNPAPPAAPAPQPPQLPPQPPQPPPPAPQPPPPAPQPPPPASQPPPPMQPRPDPQLASPDNTQTKSLVQPCSLSCGAGVPSLSCRACLCLYHPACAGLKHAPASNTFLCKNCRASCSPPSSPPPAHKSSGARRHHTQSHTQTPPDKRVLLRMKVSGGAGGQKVWAVAGAGAGATRPPPPSAAAPGAGAGAAAGAGAGAGRLPQSLVIINGRRDDKRRTRVTNGAATPIVTPASPRRRGRQRADDTDHFTPFCNRAKEAGLDVALQIFQYLGMRDLARCARVCKMWRQLASTPALWRHVRMKNSHVSDWGGLCAALKRHGTKWLDLRKMLLPANDAAFWEQFAQHIGEARCLERLELCRCPARAVEAACGALPALTALAALAIRDSSLDPRPLARAPRLHELRLKSLAGLALAGDLTPLAALTQLRHLSLTSIKDLGCAACDVVGRLPLLESLELGECTFRAEFGAVLAKLGRLRRLRLERGTAHTPSADILRAVAHLPHLTALELVNVDVKLGFDEALASCTNLRRLLIIPTYVSQSATTNKQVLSGVLRLKDSLTHLMWGVTIELLRVTELFIDQCSAGGGGAARRDLGECIPVLKPVPGCRLPMDHQLVAGPPQVEILPLPTLQRLLSAQLPNTKLKLLRIPFHATWRQSLADFQ